MSISRSLPRSRARAYQGAHARAPCQNARARRGRRQRHRRRPAKKSAASAAATAIGCQVAVLIDNREVNRWNIACASTTADQQKEAFNRVARQGRHVRVRPDRLSSRATSAHGRSGDLDIRSSAFDIPWATRFTGSSIITDVDDKLTTAPGNWAPRQGNYPSG